MFHNVDHLKNITLIMKKKKQRPNPGNDYPSSHRTIKCSLKSILREHLMVQPIINDLVVWCNDIVIETFQLIRLYCLKLYRDGRPIHFPNHRWPVHLVLYESDGHTRQPWQERLEYVSIRGVGNLQWSGVQTTHHTWQVRSEEYELPTSLSYYADPHNYPEQFKGAFCHKAIQVHRQNSDAIRTRP